MNFIETTPNDIYGWIKKRDNGDSTDYYKGKQDTQEAIRLFQSLYGMTFMLVDKLYEYLYNTLKLRVTTTESRYRSFIALNNDEITTLRLSKHFSTKRSIKRSKKRNGKPDVEYHLIINRIQSDTRKNDIYNDGMYSGINVMVRDINLSEFNDGSKRKGIIDEIIALLTNGTRPSSMDETIKDYRIRKIIRETINHYISENCCAKSQKRINELFIPKIKSEAFKKWFGDWENNPQGASKVVDKNGRPLIVYHGTTELPFKEFNNTMYGQNGGYNSPGYFTDNLSVANFFGGDAIPIRFTKLQNKFREINPQTIEDCLSFLDKYSDYDIDLRYETKDKERKIIDGMYKWVTVEPYTAVVMTERDFDNERVEKVLGRAEEKDKILQRLRDRVNMLCRKADEYYAKNHSEDDNNRYGGVVYNCYLSIKNPLEYDAGRKGFTKVPWAQLDQDARSNGNDGIIVYNVMETPNMNKLCTDYIVFNGNQIKLAFENDTFNGDNNSIIESARI